MGGRGGSSGLSNEKPVSKLIAKVYFNSSLTHYGEIQTDMRIS